MKNKVLGLVTTVGAIGLVGLVYANPPLNLGEITTGKTTLYHVQNEPRNDLSGTATDGSTIIIVDDSGAGAQPNFGFNFVRVMSEWPDTNAVNIPLTETHHDLEGATFGADGYFYITGSLTNADASRGWLTRFQVDTANNQLVDEESVNLRLNLREALRTKFGDDWYNRWKDQPGRAGGLNIEGISRAHSSNDVLLWGLRSPLYADTFPADLHSGKAIIAKVYGAFGESQGYDFQLIDLGGHGVRGMEWIPALHSYVVIGGTIEAANDYSLWRLFPDGTTVPLDLPGFDHLCRPESVIQQTENGKDYLLVISEDSGAPCVGVNYTYIKAEILPGQP